MPGRVAPARSTLRIGDDPNSLASLYGWLDEAAQTAAPAMTLSAATLQAMHVALEEAVMNVAMHAFPAGTQDGIVVSLLASAEAAILTVEDDGPPFDPTRPAAASSAASLEDAEPGGLGLRLLRHYCPDIGYERDGGRNRLTLRFATGQALDV